MRPCRSSPRSIGAPITRRLDGFAPLGLPSGDVSAACGGIKSPEGELISACTIPLWAD